MRLLDERDGLPVSLSVRPNVASLVGASEVQVWTFGTDVSVSRNFAGLAPFAGVGLNTSLAVENSDDTDVGNQVALRAIPFAGLDYNWGALSVGAQAELSSLPVFSGRLGARF